MAATHEKALAAEWLAVLLVETGDAFAAHGEKGHKGFLPQPSRYFATMVAYLLLAGAALFGEKAGKVASALGALVALTILMAPPTVKKPVSKTNQPLIISFFGYLASMFTNPPTTLKETYNAGGVPKTSTVGGVKIKYTTQTDRVQPPSGLPTRPPGYILGH